MLQGLMQDDYQLALRHILERMRGMSGHKQVVTLSDGGTRRATYAEVGDRVDRLCRGLESLGIEQGQRVGTFMWNSQEHLEVYVFARGLLRHQWTRAYLREDADDELLSSLQPSERETLVARREAGGMRFDIRMPPIGPRAHFRALRFKRFQLLREIAPYRFQLLRTLGQFVECHPIVVCNLRPHL